MKKELIYLKRDTIDSKNMWRGHELEPSTKPKTPWLRRYDFIYIRQYR
jgi:hypothetical protein